MCCALTQLWRCGITTIAPTILGSTGPVYATHLAAEYTMQNRSNRSEISENVSDYLNMDH